MPSSHHHTSANTSRKTHTKSSRVSEQDVEERLLEELKNANTNLNRITSERDRYLRLYDQANKKLSESHTAKEDLKTQVQTLREDNAAMRLKIKELEDENNSLVYANDLWDTHYTKLERTYHKIVAEFDITPSVSSGASVKLPERPKTSHKSSSRNKKELKEERPRKSEKETREKKAEKDRLSKRFDEKRAPANGRRQSFIEPWGPSGEPTPAAPSRGFAHSKSPAVQPPHGNVVYSTVPRSANPLGPSVYEHGNGNMYDDGYEDGNYHAYPVPR